LAVSGRARAASSATDESDESVLSIVGDYARRIAAKAVQDDLLFLAGGVAFDILLAGVPFFLLLASGLGYVLRQSEEASIMAVSDFLTQLMPATFSGKGTLLDPVLHEVVRTRGSAGIVGAIAFIWFSARLFASMRVVLTRVLEDPERRNFFVGKLVDIQATLAATVLTVGWVFTSAYIAIARTSSVQMLAQIGLHNPAIMRPLTYGLGRLLAFALLSGVFFAIFKLLPKRSVRWQQAAIAALSSAVMFELARLAFTAVVHRFNPASFYTGTLSAVVVVMFWIYYAALTFTFGALISQVHERRMAEQLKRTAPWRVAR
jgi:membrane protein